MKIISLGTSFASYRSKADAAIEETMASEIHIVLLIAVDEELDATLARLALKERWLLWWGGAPDCAVQEVLRQDPSLVVVQVTPWLPGGVELIRRVRKGGRQVPIIAVAMFHNDRIERAVRNAGANYYLPYANGDALVIQAVEQLLGTRPHASRLRRFSKTG